MGVPMTRTVVTSSGWIVCSIFAAEHLGDHDVPDELDAPAVEPAEALTSMPPTRTNVVSTVHWLKSAFAYPVVVKIETVLKTACRTAASPVTMRSLGTRP
jgi:hypothetical protein